MIEHTRDLWAGMRGEDLLLTGGTGFFGCWLTETFLYANRVLGLGARLTVLSRDPLAFALRAPHLCGDPALRLVQGDVRSFDFPGGGFAFVIHAATDSVGPSRSPQDEYSVIAQGTGRVLELAQAAHTRRLLLVSSGAVYGPQPPSVSHIDEEHALASSDNPYALGKRAAEALCLASAVDCTIARCFAFLGPHLPLDAHFAAGNFLRDALAGREIVIHGDGRPLRSYMYTADLAIWLWTILFKALPGRAYNVGSEDAISIRVLAERVAAGVSPGLRIRLGLQPAMPPFAAEHPPPRYIPSTNRAQTELGLATWIGLDEAIRRTAAWHRRF